MSWQPTAIRLYVRGIPSSMETLLVFTRDDADGSADFRDCAGRIAGNKRQVNSAGKVDHSSV